jgi:eukaryotic-like serine/threonine-protein kinase
MIGEVLGQFRVTAMVGAGGMGVVYKARDERLDRDVAIKVLPPGTFADEAARKRLRQEALALSRLNHPNVATVHDFNSQGAIDFLVMEMIPGATLDQKLMGDPLGERDVLRLGNQLAQGLAAAHAENIVHRDLKPGNIRITPDGRLKILDFGLAVLRESVDDHADTAALGQNLVAGSPPYMAPEQLLGDPVDQRTDIYAAGAVLYEMATGRRPHADVHGARLIDAILHQGVIGPRLLNGRLSVGLEQILLKCLDKEPERRYQSARELLVDLERLSLPSAITQPAPRARRPRAAWSAFAAVSVASVLAGAVGGARARQPQEASAESVDTIRAVAVLPLANLSGDAGQDYFADGMTDALIADLGRTGAVRVISRTSSMQYKDAHKRLADIARELGVEAVVEGSVMRSGERVRINARLVRAAGERRLWGESYERDLRDVMVLQSEVASAIAREVSANLQPRDRSLPQVDPQAHESYLRGRYLFQQAEDKSIRSSLDYFEKAVARDPRHAGAWAGIATARRQLAVHLAPDFRIAPGQAFVQVEVAANRALTLDQGLAEAHCSLAMANLDLRWDWAKAEQGFRKALDLNPNLAECHEQYAWYLASQGRLEESLARMTRARELDPVSLLVNSGQGAILMYKRQTDEGMVHMRRALELKKDFVPAHYGLGRLYLQAGRPQDALGELNAALTLSPDSPHILADVAHAHALAGRRKEALATLDRWRKVTAGSFTREEQAAHVYAALGNKDEAFALLEKAFAQHSSGLVWLKVDSRFDSLRGDPRFQSLMKRMGLA